MKVLALMEQNKTDDHMSKTDLRWCDGIGTKETQHRQKQYQGYLPDILKLISESTRIHDSCLMSLFAFTAATIAVPQPSPDAGV